MPINKCILNYFPQSRRLIVGKAVFQPIFLFFGDALFMKMRISFLVLALVLGVALASQASTLTLMSGRYTFWVDVRNSWFKDVHDARGYAFVNGNSANIQIDAPGYRQVHGYLTLTPNVFNYNVQVRLDETFVRADVVDEKFKYVPDARVDTFSQNMYWGDEYGLKAVFPKAGFTQLTARKIDVRLNGTWPFAPRVYLNDWKDKWEIEIVIRRRDMNSYSNTFSVVVTRDEAAPAIERTVDPIALAKDFAVNGEMLKNLKGNDCETVKNRQISLGNQIREVYSSVDSGERKAIVEALPAECSLARELNSISKFEALQK